jgi:hypothetical protein
VKSGNGPHSDVDETYVRELEDYLYKPSADR